ncbi:hypothetical protein GCM10011609_27810 [Lentzea pudingi]|uniref:Carrier domain-containing protein n=1 Tax=Lentzea pudingi TaxID=1789439 RepID=A0ABQ2HT93_9PSEU|nr:phosphopantetheine-binding protein [Lentzea pudingi]GGM89383.1 hypothetical protein GCM10011609_27810 [Lentzea pudingi]
MPTQWPDQFEAVVRKHLPMLGDDGVSPELVLADRGLDSIGTINLLVALEDEFDVVFPDELLAATTFETPGALWAVLASLIDR